MNRHDNSGKPNNLSDVIKLQKQLRKGLDPASVGECLGGGKYKECYRVGRWAVKECTGGHIHGEGDAVAPIDLWRRGMGRPRTFIATCKSTGIVWSIQELVTPVQQLKNGAEKWTVRQQQDIINSAGHSAGKHYDTHDANVGLTADGRLVAFDW